MMRDIYNRVTVKGISAVKSYVNDFGGDPHQYFTRNFSVETENENLENLFGCGLEKGSAAKIKEFIRSGRIGRVGRARAGIAEKGEAVPGKTKYINIYDWVIVKRNYPEFFTDFTPKQTFHTPQLSFKF